MTRIQVDFHSGHDLILPSDEKGDDYIELPDKLAAQFADAYHIFSTISSKVDRYIKGEAFWCDACEQETSSTTIRFGSFAICKSCSTKAHNAIF